MATPISPDRAIKTLSTVASAAINPQGTAIAFVRSKLDAEGKKPESQIWLCDVDGANQRQLTQVGPANSDPTWAPDGSALAYVTAREGDHPNAVAILSFEGGESQLISKHTERPGELEWSPDGISISYTLRVDPENPNETPRDPEAAPAVRVTTRADYKQDGLGYINERR